MKINNTQNYNLNNKNISSKGMARKAISTLADPDSLASVLVLESAVTGGRSANAYKRGGFAEFRERFTDDVLSAIFWIKGVDIFNKIGNKFGQHVLKLPTTEFDVGKDALRTPFNNLVDDLGNKIQDKNTVQKLEKKLAAFKFTKIIASTLLATGFVGFILPKINQKITNMMMSKDKKAEAAPQQNTVKPLNVVSIEEFGAKISNKKQQSFKGGAALMTTVAHALESNKICKMLTSDVGILTGRVTTARNKDEGIEYFFRDSASCFFYFASTPLMYKLLQKVTGTGKLTNLDAIASKQVYNNMLEQLKNPDNTFKSMNVEEFKKKTIGVLDDGAKALLEKLPFKSDVISLAELKNHITDENLIKKAHAMSKLQPKQAGVGRVLTKQQVSDVLKNGSINTPEFMQKVFNKRFGEDLINPHKFIPMKKITDFRDDIEKFAQGVIETANKKNNGIIDKNLLDKINKKSFATSAVFRGIAIAFSAFALGIAIPKIQYAITAKRTGQTGAPGLRDYNQKTESKDNK